MSKFDSVTHAFGQLPFESLKNGVVPQINTPKTGNDVLHTDRLKVHKQNKTNKQKTC